MQVCGEGQPDFSLSQQFFVCGQSIFAMDMPVSTLSDANDCKGAKDKPSTSKPNRIWRSAGMRRRLDIRTL
jgi:hypothetical protein